MAMMDLMKKIKNKTATVGVIGLGYVGLPLAVEKAKAGYDVIGFDVQKEKVDKVNKGENYIGDVVDFDLKALVARDKLRATGNYSFLKDVDTVTICVPTPLDKFKQPDLTYIINSTKEIAKYLHRDELVILESTTYPGTTEEVVLPILESTGLKVGRDFYLAFSPERVDPSNKIYHTKNIPKVVGGVTPKCSELAKALYESILESDVFVVSTPRVAELEKILENTFRIVNIALANEMAIVCDRMDINIWEVIEAAKTKPYGFMAFYPGPGVGGHCIPIDPFYLTYKAREYDYHTRLIELAGEINDSMPEFVVSKLMRLLNERKKCLNGAKVLLLGIAYKQDVDDIRESPALMVWKELQKHGAEVLYHDPYISRFKNKEDEKMYESVNLNEDILKTVDAVVITTMHTNVDYEKVIAYSPLVFDTKNVTGKIKGNKENVYVL
ncbi:MAG: UDP-N-acetyl-D-glucosamine dehydrogenase [Thermotoga sp.]|nr:MAG: UDP-N-acetyl-D-glucosamine dehydrogenase [Thermotoga sp.]